MAMTTSPTRRTQEERSSATRAKLLDATVECLIELGYAGTTTTEIVRRAGVSRGAQVHHFPTKAELVKSAVQHLARKREQELREEFTRLRATDGVSRAIDLLWSGYADPLFSAVLDLIVAARTDDELATVFGTLQLNVQSTIERFCVEVFGADVVRRRAFRDGLALTMNLMHGLALTRMAGGDPDELERLVGAWKSLVRPLFEQTSNGAKDEKGNDGRRVHAPASEKGNDGRRVHAPASEKGRGKHG
jgi:AcrR family transcriptional regulator